MSLLRSDAAHDVPKSHGAHQFPQQMKVPTHSEAECGYGHCFNTTTLFSLVQSVTKNFSVFPSEVELSTTFKNDTVVEDEIEYYYFYQTEQLTFLWILFTMIVAANSAVLVALMLSKNRKSRMNFFIMQLAIADLAVGLINVLTDIIWRTTVAFYAGNVVCKAIKFFQVLVTYSSTYVLVALSIDRYDAITHPMNFSGSWRRAKILVLLSWGLSAIFSFPAIFLNEEDLIKGRPQCWIELSQWQWQLYITLVAMSLFFIPALIISACYTIIVYTIWTKSKLMAYPKLTRCSTMSKSSTRTTKSTGSSVNDTDRKRASSRGIIPRAKIKTVKMTFVIIFGLKALCPLNSAANPIIYCLFSTRTCRNLRKLPPIKWLAEKLCTCYPSLATPLPASTCNRLSMYTSVSMTSRNSTQRQATTSRIPNNTLRAHVMDKEQMKRDPAMISKNTHV